MLEHRIFIKRTSAMWLNNSGSSSGRLISSGWISSRKIRGKFACNSWELRNHEILNSEEKYDIGDPKVYGPNSSSQKSTHRILSLSSHTQSTWAPEEEAKISVPFKKRHPVSRRAPKVSLTVLTRLTTTEFRQMGLDLFPSPIV